MAYIQLNSEEQLTRHMIMESKWVVLCFCQQSLNDTAWDYFNHSPVLAYAIEMAQKPVRVSHGTNPPMNTYLCLFGRKCSLYMSCNTANYILAFKQSPFQPHD